METLELTVLGMTFRDYWTEAVMSGEDRDSEGAARCAWYAALAEAMKEIQKLPPSDGAILASLAVLKLTE